MKMQSVLLACAGSFSLFAWAAANNSARADALQPAVYGGSFILEAAGYNNCVNYSLSCAPVSNVINQSVSGPGTISNSVSAPLISDGTEPALPGVVANYTVGASSSGSFTVTNGPLPGISASGTMSTVPISGVAATLEIDPSLEYSIEFVGAAGKIQVGVQASGQASVSTPTPPGYITTPASTVGFTVSLDATHQVVADYAEAGPDVGVPTASFADNNSYAFSADTPYTVDLFVDVIANTTGQADCCDGGGGTATVSGSVDPQFFVPQGYTLELSQDIGNGVTPLPAALPLFATGLGALGLLGWRRKRNSAVVPSAV
jgi:hypothetical protein